MEIKLIFPNTLLFRTAAIEYLNELDAKQQPVFVADEELAPETTDEQNCDSLQSYNETPIDSEIDEEPIGDDFICPVTGERLDRENGYPWDERIHSIKKSKLIKTREWKLIKGIEAKSPGLVEELRAEFDAKRSETNTDEIDEEHVPEVKEPEVKAPEVPAPPPSKKVIQLFEMPSKPSFVDILSFVTCRLEQKPEFEENIQTVLKQFKINEISEVGNLTPNLLAAFAEWLIYEWSEVE